MKKLLAYSCLAFVIAQSGAYAANGKKPVITISATATTATGAVREFSTPAGRVAWSPSLPLYRGDLLRLTFNISRVEPSRVSVKLDGRPIADLKRRPWSVLINTSNLAPGKHVAKGDIRFPGTPRMYSIAEFPFHVHPPASMVKGIVESIGPEQGKPPVPMVEISPPKLVVPPESRVDETFQVTLCSLDLAAGGALRRGEPVEVKGPVAFYLSGPSKLDRWAYVITRDGRQIAGAGPMRPTVYLQVAPKSGSEPGLLPGKLLLRAWGVTGSGTYSRPVEAELVVE
ncbi:MAG: hypothetical protein Q7T82_21255 [Armatimonadota bacterium]|nr:hypothetical protein [Armatimonadota bacterium]